jgi:hypothetical protein
LLARCRSVSGGSAWKRTCVATTRFGVLFIFVPAGALKGQDFVITLSDEIIERSAVDRCERTASINGRILA